VPVVLLALLTAAVGVVFRHLLLQPLWWDEQWRALRISLPQGVWSHLDQAPGAFGVGLGLSSSGSSSGRVETGELCRLQTVGRPSAAVRHMPELSMAP